MILRWTPLFLSFLHFTKTASSKVTACYTEYEHPSTSSIPSGLCTHYMLIGSTSIDWLGNIMLPNETVTQEFAELRKREPTENKPALLLCVTGANPHWSRLVSFDGNMRKFANAAAKYLKENGFQGLDLDWEFPLWSDDASMWDSRGFTRLLETLHEVLSADGLILTAAVSGPPTITRVAYNVTALKLFADLVFVMNYDFHVWQPTIPLVGFNAPLYHLPAEPGILREMNSEASMRTYLKLGLSREKAIFGLPVYNLAYTLVNGKVHNVYSPADEVVYGLTTHDTTCNLTSTPGWRRVWNKHAASSYLYNEDRKLWITEETDDSIRIKATYARDQNFGGIMIFSLGTDDVDGDCRGEPFPLTKLARKMIERV